MSVTLKIKVPYFEARIFFRINCLTCVRYPLPLVSSEEFFSEGLGHVV